MIDDGDDALSRIVEIRLAFDRLGYLPGRKQPA
jgi:hypothetical protein